MAALNGNIAVRDAETGALKRVEDSAGQPIAEMVDGVLCLTDWGALLKYQVIDENKLRRA